MGRPKKTENPFEGLAEEFQAAVDGGSDDEIRRLVADVAFNEVLNLKNKKEDVHLQEMKAAYKEAGAQYVEASDANKQKIRYGRQVLEGRGKL